MWYYPTATLHVHTRFTRGTHTQVHHVLHGCSVGTPTQWSTLYNVHMYLPPRHIPLTVRFTLYDLVCMTTLIRTSRVCIVVLVCNTEVATVSHTVTRTTRVSRVVRHETRHVWSSMKRTCSTCGCATALGPHVDMSSCTWLCQVAAGWYCASKFATTTYGMKKGTSLQEYCVFLEPNAQKFSQMTKPKGIASFSL